MDGNVEVGNTDATELDTENPYSTQSVPDILDIEDARVWWSYPGRNFLGAFDVERSVRLFNYLVAIGHLAYHGKPLLEDNLEELKRRPKLFCPTMHPNQTSDVQSLLEPQILRFLESVIVPDPAEATIFFWARGLLVDGIYSFYDIKPDMSGIGQVFENYDIYREGQENDAMSVEGQDAVSEGGQRNDAVQAWAEEGQRVEEVIDLEARAVGVVRPRPRRKPRYVRLFDSVTEFGQPTFGLVYDQYNCRVTFVMYKWQIHDVLHWEDSDCRCFLWVTLEEMLSNWIYLISMGKVMPEMPEPRVEDERRHEDQQRHEHGRKVDPNKISVWKWYSYSRLDVDEAVNAFNWLTDSIEMRMPRDALLPYDANKPLFTDAELDAAGVPWNCFVREFLTRVKTPRFTQIGPGLRVPHDAAAFAKRQKLTRAPSLRRKPGLIPAVLLFAASDSSRSLPQSILFGFPIPWQRMSLLPTGHVGQGDDDDDGDWDGGIPAGLYSEAVDRDEPDNNEDGFRLLVPFYPRPWTQPEHMSDLFQNSWYPYGGCNLKRAQRLSSLLQDWRGLVEEGTWQVGQFGVVGGLENFLRASRESTCESHWISPTY